MLYIESRVSIISPVAWHYGCGWVGVGHLSRDRQNVKDCVVWAIKQQRG